MAEHTSLDEMRMQITELTAETEAQKNSITQLKSENEELLVQREEMRVKCRKLEEELEEKKLELQNLQQQPTYYIERSESATQIITSTSAEKSALLVERDAEILSLKHQLEIMHKEKSSTTAQPSSLVKRVIDHTDRKAKAIETPDAPLTKKLRKQAEKEKKAENNDVATKGKGRCRGTANTRAQPRETRGQAEKGKQKVLEKDQEITNADKEKGEQNKKLLMNKASITYKYLPANYKKVIENVLNTEGLAGQVWTESKVGYEFLIVQQFLDTIEDEKLDTMLIDNWGRMLKEKVKASKFVDTTTIFSSMSWAYPVQGGIHPTYSELAKFEIDDKIEDALESNLLIFPLNTTRKGDNLTGIMDHFTLLTFDTTTLSWKHYNSLNPAEEHEEDMHFEKAKILIEYVEDKMKAALRAKGQMAVIDPEFQSTYTPGEFPKQDPNSVDCGAIVCEMMEKLVMDQAPLPNNWATKENIGKCRAKLVKEFIDDMKRRKK